MHCEQCLLIFIDTGFYTCILSALMSGSACMPPICAVDTIVFSICPVVPMRVPSRATMNSSVWRAGRACQSNTHKLRWRHHMTVSGLQFSSFYFMFYIRYWRLSVGFNRRRQLVVVLSSTTTVARFASWLSVTQHRVGVMWPSTFLRVSRALTKCSVGDVVVPSAVLELTW